MRISCFPTSRQYVEKHGAESFLYPDVAQSVSYSYGTASTSGDGYSNTAAFSFTFIRSALPPPTFGGATIGGTAASTTIANQTARGAFVAGASTANAIMGTWNYMLKIKLADLHLIFKELDLMANPQLRLRFRVNQGTSASAVESGKGMSLTRTTLSSGNVCPVMVAASSTGNPMAGVLAASAGFSVAWGAVVNSLEPTIDGTYMPFTTSRFYVPFVILRLLSRNPSKKVRFNDCYAQWFYQRAGSEKQSSQFSAAFDLQLPASVKNAKYVMLLPFAEQTGSFASAAVQEFQSPFGSAPWTLEYGAHEIGLLVAHMLCPQKRRFAAHWSMVEDGAIPAGLFGRYMTRDCCQNILRDLHFVDNSSDHGRDKVWKLRPVVDKIQERFLSSWTLPAIFSFDEGVLPATSKRNTTRMFMSDKSHRYGSKLFMLCDAQTAYCHRFSSNLLSMSIKVYAGKHNHVDGGDTGIDVKTGAAAILRNLKAAFTPESRHNWHAVIIDRYYTSVLHAVELLKMKVFVVGTIMTNRLGFDNRSPAMTSCLWWDRNPIYYLCTGSVMTSSTIERKIKRIRVGCPQLVNDYQNWMGGVDRHDPLRLQNYSLQMSTRFTKYYKGLFLGVPRSRSSQLVPDPQRGSQDQRDSRYETLRLVYSPAEPAPATEGRELCRDPSDSTFVPPKALANTSAPCARTRAVRRLGYQKRKPFATTYFCERCSVDNAKCWLCNKIRREYKGVAKTCFEIWHDDFGAGQDIPAHLGKRVVLRRPGKNTENCKKTRRELQLLREEGRDGDDADNDSNDE
ncbi:hypothetical protein F441_00501 [Phytophthora nicotianae CJ01A1]|uniref:PiggyBac transposable element-derived protein domain-containing protein n=1 Tax=Phytophthora nicotianae CJ01A1 TaxID=1317063 RepID=W2XW35_PHYNI|nr:hypothetical protein F441_00501 [Phytophthora nicotianae CJ01A1]